MIILIAAASLTGESAPPAHASQWWPILWLVVFASLGGYVLYVYVTQSLGATGVSTLLYLTPPATMLWAYLMFGEPLTGLGFLGLLISGIGVLLALSLRRVGLQESLRTERTCPVDRWRR